MSIIDIHACTLRHSRQLFVSVNKPKRKGKMLCISAGEAGQVSTAVVQAGVNREGIH